MKIPTLICCAVLVFAAAAAQQVDSWTAMQQLQADLKADRQAVVAANLPLSEGEAKTFWPVYKEYRGEVEKLGDRLAKLITAYAANYQSMNETKADAFFAEWLAIERDKSAFARSSCPGSAASCPARRRPGSSRSRTSSTRIVNVGLASEIPLLPLKK